PGGPGGPGGPPPQGGFGGQGGPPPPGGPGDQGGPPQGGPGGRMDEQHKKNEAAIKAILTEAQFGRVKQIAVQLAGARAILDKQVQTQLALTDGQKSKVADLVKADQQEMRAQFDK